jgi:hypothetical protein
MFKYANEMLIHSNRLLSLGFIYHHEIKTIQ